MRAGRSRSRGGAVGQSALVVVCDVLSVGCMSGHRFTFFENDLR